MVTFCYTYIYTRRWELQPNNDTRFRCAGNKPCMLVVFPPFLSCRLASHRGGELRCGFCFVSLQMVDGADLLHWLPRWLKRYSLVAMVSGLRCLVPGWIVWMRRGKHHQWINSPDGEALCTDMMLLVRLACLVFFFFFFFFFRAEFWSKQQILIKVNILFKIHSFHDLIWPVAHSIWCLIWWDVASQKNYFLKKEKIPTYSAKQ